MSKDIALNIGLQKAEADLARALANKHGMFFIGLNVEECEVKLDLSINLINRIQTTSDAVIFRVEREKGLILHIAVDRPEQIQCISNEEGMVVVFYIAPHDQIRALRQAQLNNF